MKNRVAILGLGLMGSGMAHRLLSSEFQLSVYSRTREKAKPLADAGAFVAGSPAEAAARLPHSSRLNQLQIQHAVEPEDPRDQIQ